MRRRDNIHGIVIERHALNALYGSDGMGGKVNRLLHTIVATVTE